MLWKSTKFQGGGGEGVGERLGFNRLCPFSFFSSSNGAFEEMQCKYVYYVLKIIYINSFKSDLETFTFYALVRKVYVLVIERDYNGADRHLIRFTSFLQNNKINDN